VATLTATNRIADDEEGICGNFQRVRDWGVTNPVQGVIIQRITRTFNVQRHNTNGTWSAINGAALNTYVTDPGSTVDATVLQYWELWTVSATGAISDGGDDTFGMCSLIPDATHFANTTKGSFTMAGEAYFYATNLAPAALGFAANAVSTAGGLFSRSTDPAGTLGGVGLAPAGAAVRYSVTSTWDSSSTATTNPGPDHQDFPDAAYSVIT
jgi:hypothetical protein